MDQGQTAAFAGALDRPPTSTWEIINPREYEKGHIPPVPLLPDIHPLVDKLYRPYDIGQVGQLDVQILTGLFGGETAPATSRRPGTAASTGPASCAAPPRPPSRAAPLPSPSFISPRGETLPPRRHSHSSTPMSWAANTLASSPTRPPNALRLPLPAMSPSEEQVYTTNEGPVVITTRGKMVFVSESFPLDLARKLTSLILDAQGTGAMQTASLSGPLHPEAARSLPIPHEPLSASFVQFFANCGVMKGAVDAEMRAAAK